MWSTPERCPPTILVARGTTRPEREAVEWAARRGGAFRRDVSDVSLAQMRAVNAEIAKIPAPMLRKAARAGARWEIVTGVGVTVHPDLAYLRGIQPNRWLYGLWDEADGAGGDDGSGPLTVVMGNRLGRRFAGDTSLVLHEHGHTIDTALRCPWIRERWNDPDDFAPLHRANLEAGLVGSEYEQVHPGEYWAESFARFFCCRAERATLPANVRAYFAELEASCA